MAAGFVIVEGVMAHSIRKQGDSRWWLIPMMGVSAHAVGIGLTVMR